MPKETKLFQKVNGDYVASAKVDQATWSTLVLETWYPSYVELLVKLTLSLGKS